MINNDVLVVPVLPGDHINLVERLRGDSFEARITEVETGAQAVLVGDFSISVPGGGKYIAVNHNKPLTETFESYDALVSFLRSNVPT
jgi:hypothetical protein